MIRFTDATVLAYTKLRTHRIRTGITIAIAGLLFGLIAAVIIVVQGVFDSVDRFSDEGLNNRTIVSISRTPQSSGFNEYEHRDDPAFVAEVETAHKVMIAKKQVAAKKYGISYDAAVEDPSPISIDPITKQRVLSDASLGSETVQELGLSKRKAAYSPFDIEAYVKPYSTATVLGTNEVINPRDGMLVYMKDGKEAIRQSSAMQQEAMYGPNGPPMLSVLEASVTKPFITSATFDASKGEIPGVIPFATAEKHLGYKALPSSAPTADKLDRLSDVRSRISEVTVSYCYRNQASQALLTQAVTQDDEITRNTNDKLYVKPKLLYKVPSEVDCGAVTIVGDTRTAAEKKQAANLELYEKEIGTYIGEPVQQKVIIRGVGVSNDAATSMGNSVSGVIQTLLGSSLGYGSISIPADMLAQVPAEYRLDQLFAIDSTDITALRFDPGQSYLVEFGDKNQARAVMEKTGSGFGGTMSGDVYVIPFGSGVLIVDELRRLFEQLLVWVFIVVGTVAIIILGSMIGRTIAEGRRESAVFRAIGAKRSDIAAIYGTYALLLSLRAVLFAAVLAIVLALIVEVLFWHDATLGARLAYAASDTTREFHLFSLNSIYLLAIAAVIVVAGLIGSIIPILLGARRSPIKDMRDNT